MRRLFFLIIALLAYGSLYPWQFHFWGPIWPAVIRVFHDWPVVFSFDNLMDMALNVVVYVPLGLTGYLSFASGFRWPRAVWPVAAGFVLSLSVETLQSFLPGRVPSGMDLTCNTLGSAAGVAIGAGYESVIVRWLAERLRRRSGRAPRRPSSALMMLIVLAGHYLAPMSSNAIRLLSLHHRPTAVAQVWSWREFFAAAITWLLAGRFAGAVAGKPEAGERTRTFQALLIAFALALATRLVSPNLLFTWPMVAGAGLGVLVWGGLEGRAFDRGFAVLTAAWLIGDGLYPYVFTGHNNFEWIPFAGMLTGDWTVGVSVLLTKLWMYGAVFWTWERAGMSRLRTSVILMAVLAAIEFAQRFLPDRVSTMTDIAMGAIAAGLLWAVERRYGT